MRKISWPGRADVRRITHTALEKTLKIHTMNTLSNMHVNTVDIALFI